jgi:hypothetical protein
VWVAESTTGGGCCCAGLEFGELGFVLGHCCGVDFGFGWLLLWFWSAPLLRHRRGTWHEGKGLERADQPGFNTHRSEQGTEQLSTDITRAFPSSGCLEKVTLLQRGIDVIRKLVLVSVLARPRGTRGAYEHS